MIIDTEKVFDSLTVCELIGVRPGTLRAWVHRGKICPFAVIRGRVALWTKDQISELLIIKQNAKTGRPRKFPAVR